LGLSHSCERPTSLSFSPIEEIISVPLGINDIILIQKILISFLFGTQF